MNQKLVIQFIPWKIWKSRSIAYFWSDPSEKTIVLVRLRNQHFQKTSLWSLTKPGLEDSTWVILGFQPWTKDSVMEAARISWPHITWIQRLQGGPPDPVINKDPFLKCTCIQSILWHSESLRHRLQRSRCQRCKGSWRKTRTHWNAR